MSMAMDITELTHICNPNIDELVTQFVILEKIWKQKLDTADKSTLPTFQRYQATKEMSGKVGRPKFNIDMERVVGMRNLSFDYKVIAKVIGVHRTTLWRRIKESNVELESFSSISENDLDSIIGKYKTLHPLSGERMVTGMLRQKGYHVFKEEK